MDREKIIDRILGKKNVKLVNDCSMIFGLFDPNGQGAIEDFPLGNFLCEATKWDEFIKRICREKDEDLREFLDYRLQNVTFDVAFGVGFVLGGMFDISNHGVRKNIDAIKKVIKERPVLPYLPKGKKERRMP